MLTSPKLMVPDQAGRCPVGVSSSGNLLLPFGAQAGTQHAAERFSGLALRLRLFQPDPLPSRLLVDELEQARLVLVTVQRGIEVVRKHVDELLGHLQLLRVQLAPAWAG